MTKQFSNVDKTGNTVIIGGKRVRVYETGHEHVVDIDHVGRDGGVWFNKTDATALRDWLNNVLQDATPCSHPMESLFYYGAVSGMLNQFRCNLCDAKVTLFGDDVKAWQDMRKSIEEITAHPLYEHDCVECVYLGRYQRPDGGNKYDLYVHPKHAGNSHATLIARFGKDGDYLSTIEQHAYNYSNDTPIGQAYKLAKARGLVQ